MIVSLRTQRSLQALVLAGLLATQADEVEATYAGHFTFERRQREEWVMLAGRRRD